MRVVPILPKNKGIPTFKNDSPPEETQKKNLEYIRKWGKYGNNH